MCRGFFSDGKPIVPARLIILTSQGIKEGNVTFLIDTGSDNTALSLIDIIRLNLVELFIAAHKTKIEGAGGETEIFALKRPFFIRFDDYSPIFNRISHHFELLEELWILPNISISVLGRDILNRFKITYKANEGEIIMRRNDFSEGFYCCYSEEI